MRLKGTTILFLVLFLFACKENDKNRKNKKDQNNQTISDPNLQDSLFNNLKRLTEFKISNAELNDSLAFLILPLEASCPACREKTIDSISKYKNRLDKHHYVIIIGNGNKSITRYFQLQDKEVPVANGIFYDTTGFATLSKMTDKNPNVYYSVNQKVYSKITCKPATIKGDLKYFFQNL